MRQESMMSCPGCHAALRRVGHRSANDDGDVVGAARIEGVVDQILADLLGRGHRP